MRNPPKESRLLILAAVFLFLYALSLTLSPAVRMRSWQVDFIWQPWLGFAAWLLIFGLASVLANRWLPRRDPYLLPIGGLLTGWGLLTIYRLFPQSGLRQSAWLLVAGAILLAGMYFPGLLNILRRYKYLWLTLGLLLTGLTLVMGTNPLGYGPRMWLGCCGLYLQPSEPLKLLLVVYLAAYLADKVPAIALPARRRAAPTTPRTEVSNPLAEDTRNVRRQAPAVAGSLLPLLAPTLIMLGLSLSLLVVQRDLGTASIFLFVYFAVVYIATGRKEVLITSVVVLILFAALGYVLFDLVRLRVDAWLNPWLDPSGRSYQIVQSLLAVANGGLLGRGPGIGNPGLVPVAHSDFIFSSVSEESGLVGGLGMLLLLALFANRGLRMSLNAPNTYLRYLAAGLTCLTIAQSILIIGGTLRLLPLTGVTLPFVSYGGSSLVVTFLILLFLLHISAQSGDRPAYLPNPHAYLQLGGLLLAGLAAAALVAAWWGVYRGPDLLTRTDNPRRAISDLSVPRGAFLDRKNEPLQITDGSAGSLTRVNLYPQLSSLLGYNHPVYGQAGLEAELDPYLRGVRGNPGMAIWWNHLLYGQPPPGLDVRLSLDTALQSAADRILGDQTGALVLLNAQTGEILAMASHPTYDANRLDDQWESLVSDPSSPLLNRATQGLYPVGGLLPEALQAIITDSQAGQLAESSPMQMALAAAALSGAGVQPAPRLALAVNTPSSGWVLLPADGEPKQVLDSASARQAALALAVDDGSIWENTHCAGRDGSPQAEICWYLAGTLTAWQGPPLAMVVVVEENSPNIAREIGQAMLKAAFQNER